MWSSFRSMVASHVTAIALIVLIGAAALNLWTVINGTSGVNPWFEYSSMAIGAFGGFLIVKLVIQAHEARRWLLFRQYMAWDLHNATLDLISVYEARVDFLQPRLRRFDGSDQVDYFQTADAPVILRRFRAELDRRRTDVRSILNLGTVGITHDTAAMIAKFKSKYDHLYNLTIFLIECDDATGPNRPDKNQHRAAHDAWTSLFEDTRPAQTGLIKSNILKNMVGFARRRPAGDAPVGATGPVSELFNGQGPFIQLLNQVADLAEQVELEVETAGIGAERIVTPPLDVGRSITDDMRADHRERVQAATAVDQRLATCAEHALRPTRD